MNEKKQVWKPGNMLYPVPAVMVSCGNKNGEKNIITIAWAGTICSDPAMVSISVRPERYSYSMIRDKPYDKGTYLCDRLVRRKIRTGCG